MKDVLVSMLARVVMELPYVLIFWIMEVLLLVPISRGLLWEVCVGLLALNLLIVAVCDLLDQLLDRLFP